MKNLNFLYKKTRIQKLQIVCIIYYRGKYELYIYDNLIGFYKEVSEPKNSEFINIFHDFYHWVDHLNLKLYNKYGNGILKTENKKWLRNCK